MNAIVVPKPLSTKDSDRPKVEDALKPRLPDSARVACGERANDEAAPNGLFDRQAALDRVEGNRELLRSMVGIFSMQWRDCLAEIAGAERRRDGATLERTANRLKRSLGSLGAGQACRLAQELAELGGERRFRDVAMTQAPLELEIERFVNALKAFSKETIPGAAPPPIP
jgi:HPt (histidine-containing phosphotransfer) domain-containing protein